MGRFILVTGGARSGKSSFAAEMAGKFGSDIVYIATSIPLDKEMEFRIRKHREQRPAEWETIEAYRDLDKRLGNSLRGKSAVILDCVTIMVTNLMMDIRQDWENAGICDIVTTEELIKDEVFKLIDVIKKGDIPFIIVTNELGMGVVPEYALPRIFRDISGRMNQLLAANADEVYLCVSGIPVKIKG